MAKQTGLALYGKGIHKTRAGHLRYHAPRPVRLKYVHRKVMEDMIAETPYSVRLMLPWPYEVHHQDYNKEHNCGANLLMVSESLHSAMTVDQVRRDDGGRFGRKYVPVWKPAPQYVLDLQDSREQRENEVPF